MPGAVEILPGVGLILIKESSGGKQLSHKLSQRQELSQA